MDRHPCHHLFAWEFSSFYACHIRLQCRLSLDFRLEAVSVVVSRSHIALVKQNPQWPAPRYTEMPQDPKGPAFLCLAKHKITDVTSLVGTFHVHLPLHGQFNKLLACWQTLYFLFSDRRARVWKYIPRRGGGGYWPHAHRFSKRKQKNGRVLFTKRFRKIPLESKCTWHFGSFHRSNGTSEKVVLFFRTEYSKRKFVLHLFKAIFKNSLSPSRSFFGKWSWFAQMVNAVPAQNSSVHIFAYHLPKPWTDWFDHVNRTITWLLEGK